jgi:glycosyltransferase involved in cell wall biosynthesis
MLLGAAGIFAAQRLGVPIVTSYHTNLAAYCKYFGLGALEAPAWAYRRFLHSQAAITLCPSRSTAQELERRGFAHPRVWSRGVDTQLFSPARRSEAWRRQVAGDHSHPIVLYVGRLSHEKNLGALVAAHSALARDGARLVFVGDGPARATLERAMSGATATFTGYLQGEQLAQAYASADVFAFPSLTETFGQVIQEAMASGLPVVAFDAEGVRDQVRAGETGFLARPGDTAGFAQALEEVIRSPQLRAAMGAAALTIARQRTWDRVMEALREVYEMTLAQKQVAHAA